MAEVIKMPKLSDTMTDGVVAQWHKKIGDKVKSGELLAEIETDKATMEFEAYDDGVLLYIGVEKGQGAPVDSLLCIIGNAGEDITSLLKESRLPAATKLPEPIATSAPAAIKSVAVPAPTIQDTKPLVQQLETTAAEKSNGRTKASPLAKKMATEKGLTVTNITGSGDGGRVVKRDVENFNPQSYQSKSHGLLVENFTEENISQMRKTIARRLAESKFTSPHFYLTMQIDMDAAMAAREAIIKESQQKISFNDFVIKACAGALKKHPKVNSSWRGETIRFNQHVHIGVAVAVEDGLLVPVVRFADSKSLHQINGEVKALAEKAKSKKLQPQEWEGNTFTISNLGMFGIEEFTAIINPPDSCILAVGAIVETPVVRNGQITIGHVMKVTLSCDHRVVDGATGSAFLQTLKNLLEQPVLMFV